MTPDLSGFGAVHGLEPLTGGHRNSVFRVWIGDQCCVAKSTTRSEAALAWVTRLMNVAARCGIVVPKMLRSASGDFASHGWTLETWFDGRAADPGDVSAFHAPLSALHETTASWPQRPGLAGMQELQHAPHAGDIDLTTLPAPVAALCRLAWAGVTEAPRCAIHGDVGPGNMRMTHGGRPAMLDWDEARVDAAFLDFIALDPAPPPEHRRAHLAWEVACGWKREPAHAATCLVALQAL